jgi:hypothetical protein
MSLFDGLQSYAGKFEEIGRRNFTAEEISAVARAEVKSSDYGLSCCFFMKSGVRKYIPMSTNSSYQLGDTVDLTKAQVVTLHRDGDGNILRVE